MADEAIRVAVELFATTFFDTADGTDLDALALDRFGSAGARLAATAAVGEVQWTRVAAGTYTILAGTRFSGTLASGETVSVQTSSAVSVGALDTVVDLPVQALTTGRGGNAAAGTIDTVVDVQVADPTATVAQAEPLAGGTEAETDEAYRARLRQLWTTLRRGTAAALETGALQVAGVTVVTVDEADGGVVNVIIGEPVGNGNSTLVDNVTAELEDWRAAGVQVVVLAAAREVVSIALTVYVERGADQATVGAACKAGIEAYGDSLAPGVAAQRSRVEQACHDASELVVGVDFDTLALELQPSAPENAIRFEAASIDITFVQVA